MIRSQWKMHSIKTQLPGHMDTSNSRQLLLKSTQKGLSHYLLTNKWIWYRIISDEIWAPLSAQIVVTIKSGVECSSTSQITVSMKILSSVRHSWAWGSDETGLAGNRVYQHTSRMKKELTIWLFETQCTFKFHQFQALRSHILVGF